MQFKFKIAMIATGIILEMQAAAQVTFYEGEEFRGASFRVDTTIQDFDPQGFNDRASSAVVEQRRWEVCDDEGFRGRCTVLSPGSYPPLEQQVQYPVSAPSPLASAYDDRRRADEHLFEVPVHSIRAVLGPP